MIDVCGYEVSANRAALIAIQACLIVMLFGGALAGQWIERRYQRRRVHERVRAMGRHSHMWAQAGPVIEDAYLVECACGAVEVR